MNVYEGTGQATTSANLAMILQDGHMADPVEVEDFSPCQQGEEEKEGTSLRCLSKAMELPLVSGISVSVVATTDYIASTRPVSTVTEKILNVGEREDVKSVISSMQTVYDNNLASRVEDLKTSINPTLKTMDDYACSGLDKVSGKVSETREAYVDPVVDKMTSTKETYVDPAVEKVVDIKDKTTQIVSDCMETATNVRTNYISPAIDVATNVKDNYVMPAITKAYTATEDPSKAYSEAIVYGKEVLISTKDVAINKALCTVDSAKQYFASTKHSTVDNVVHTFALDATEYIKTSSKKSLDRAITFAKQNRGYALEKAQGLAMALHKTAHDLLQTRYPSATEFLDKGVSTLTATTQFLFHTAKTTVMVTVETTRTVHQKLSVGYAWTTQTYSSVKQVATTTKDTVLNYGHAFTSAHESNIRYLVDKLGIASYIDLIGVQLKEKSA